MTDEQNPAPMPSSDPPPLAPLVEEASANSNPDPMPPAAPPVMAAPPPAAPPPVAWGAPPVAVATAGGRTTLAAAAGVIMIILGILGGLLGLFIAVVGGSLADNFADVIDVPGMNDPGGVVGGIFAFLGILVVVYSLVYLIGGIGVVRSRGWGRVMGLIVGILSGLVWLSGLTSSQQGSVPFAIVMLAIHVYIVVVLIMFWKNKTA